ncbi:helix-turn-helix domain-containing protein [Bifidobacterium sp. ESL0745]|uniref:winged helix-turn-helix transcriptional regulator n=1 Tax=Bifidobacterium sp. ESL0745 TaxID=2983226 RepID=UPI0023F73ABD|nr:helix-turn-helix domain-containing protein [Bifidobacterium sp. ESL0745]MDF7665042.1 helix-turn-helix domain-containing protein [Bifidobacterium sp. ESL0745]
MTEQKPRMYSHNDFQEKTSEKKKHTGDVYSPDCPCRGLLDVVSGKWSAMAVESLADGPMRFGQLQRRLVGISPKVLTATLRRLEDAGLIDRVVFAEVPSHVEYSLTEDGRSAVVPPPRFASLDGTTLRSCRQTQRGQYTLKHECFTFH